MRQGPVWASGGNRWKGLCKLRKMRRSELDQNRAREHCLRCGIRKIFTVFLGHRRYPLLMKLAKQLARKVDAVGVSEARPSYRRHYPNRTETHRVHQRGTPANPQNVKVRISPPLTENVGFDTRPVSQMFITNDVDRAFFIVVTCDAGFPLMFLTCRNHSQRAPCV